MDKGFDRANDGRIIILLVVVTVAVDAAFVFALWDSTHQPPNGSQKQTNHRELKLNQCPLCPRFLQNSLLRCERATI